MGMNGICKKLFSLVVFLMITFIVSACDSGQTVRTGNVDSTFLADVYIAGLQLGDNINDIDLSGFSPAYNESLRFDYSFQEIMFYVDTDGHLTKILGRMGVFHSPRENEYIGVTLSISGKELTTLSEIKYELGEQFYDYWYDREQNMRAATYTDKENNIIFTVVYMVNTMFGENAIPWVILR
jgi:hypothetical protein